MRIKEIVEKLCNHEISKEEAIKQISIITDGLRMNDALEFIVEHTGFTSENNHGILKLKLPYEYSKMEGKVKEGDKVDVLIVP